MHTGYGNGSADFPIRLYVYYKTSQNISTNKSEVTCGMYVTTPGSAYDIGQWVDYNATSYVGTSALTFSGTIPNFGGTRWIAENKTFTVLHNSDGSGKATIAWKWNVNSSWGGFVYPSGSFTIDLPSIPRKAEITAAYDFNDNSNPTINYKNPAGSAAQTLQARITVGSVAVAAYRNIAKTGATSYTFSLTAAEREALRTNSSRTAASGKTSATFTIKTVIGGTTYTHSKSVYYTLQETSATKPTVSITCAPYPDLNAPFKGIYLQNKNGVKVTYTASAKYGASVSSYKAGGIGISASGNPSTTGVLKYDGTLSVTGTVKDSRGFSNSAKANIDVIPYNKPYIAPYTGASEVVCTRCDSGGNISSSGIYLKIKASRVYSPVTIDEVQKNFCAVQYRVKSAAASNVSYTAWTDVLAKSVTGTNLIDVTLQDVVPEISQAYTVQLRAVDDVGSESSIMTFPVPTDQITFHLKQGGNGAAFNKYCEKEGYLEIGFDVEINGDKLDDFVVEEGTRGIWRYRKWSSGAAECWGTSKQTVTFEKTWGEFYVSAASYGAEAAGYPFVFIERPVECVTARCDDNAVWVYAESAGAGMNTKSQTGTYKAIRPTAAKSESQTLYLDIMVKGKWK